MLLLYACHAHMHVTSRRLKHREGVEASRQGVELNIFRLSDYQIPYGYTPLLVATADTVRCTTCAGPHCFRHPRICYAVPTAVTCQVPCNHTTVV